MMPLIDIFFNLGILIAGFFIVGKSSELIVYSFTDYARKLGLSVYMLGFTAISLTSIMPGFIAALTGAQLNLGGVVFGTVLGSNLFKIPLLGIILLAGKKVKNDTNAIGGAPIMTLFLTVLPFVLSADNSLDMGDGLILTIAYILYLYSFLHSFKLGKAKGMINSSMVYKDILIFFGTLMALLISARFLIDSSMNIAELFEVPAYLTVLIIMGAATSLPELIYEFKTVVNENGKLSLGYIHGIIVANSTLVLGITSFLMPITIDFKLIFPMGIFLIIGTILSIVLINKEELNWKHGTIFIGFYIAYLLTEIIILS